MSIAPPSEPAYQDSTITLHHGDCLEVMATLPDASVDAIVTDPPYGLGFMGKAWDDLPPGEEWARECLRVLKPGGHLLAFGGSRTWHRLAVAIEDAGFDIRDSIAWLYGSGFPKSLDVSKAIDRMAPRAGMFADFAAHYGERRRAAGLNHREVCEAGRFYGEHNKGGASVNWEKGYGVPTLAQWATLAPLLDLSDEWLPLIERVEAEREVTGQRSGSRLAVAPGQGMERGALDLDITAPATDAARTWQGWGTALKPAFEPIVVARKPLAGTVAANVLAHGTGALNIDGCRVAADWENDPNRRGWQGGNSRDGYVAPSVTFGAEGERVSLPNIAGRWPANVVLDESQAAALDEQSGELTDRSGGTSGTGGKVYGGGSGLREQAQAFVPYRGGDGGASRFFYVAKADASERVRVDGIAHPTVKPLALMRWLVRLVTPPGGTVLEPFAGSGTTVEACILEGFKCIAIEREADYLPLIVQRINRRRDPVEAVRAAQEDGGLFDLLDGGAA